MESEERVKLNSGKKGFPQNGGSSVKASDLEADEERLITEATTQIPQEQIPRQKPPRVTAGGVISLFACVFLFILVSGLIGSGQHSSKQDDNSEEISLKTTWTKGEEGNVINNNNNNNEDVGAQHTGGPMVDEEAQEPEVDTSVIDEPSSDDADILKNISADNGKGKVDEDLTKQMEEASSGDDSYDDAVKNGHNKEETDADLDDATKEATFEYMECIPKQCFGNKHFIRRPELLADQKNFTLLASYPGSGNTWTRSIIEEGTRIYTGSVYPTDKLLLKDGFLGENIDSFQSSGHPLVSVIKTHYPLFNYLPNPKTRLVIQILRSPFDALLSEFNREFSNGGDSHVALASYEAFQKHFHGWFHRRGTTYVGHVRFWDGPRYWETHAKDRRDDNGVTSFTLERKIFVPWGQMTHKYPDIVANRTVPVLVMYYEDFVTNLPVAMHRLFTYLKKHLLGEAMPSVNSAIMCALKNFERQAAVHRSQTGSHKPYNPYADPNGAVTRRGLVKEFCDRLKDFWFEEKWGDCYKAPLQSSRLKRWEMDSTKFPKTKCT